MTEVLQEVEVIDEVTKDKTPIMAVVFNRCGYFPTHPINVVTGRKFQNSSIWRVFNLKTRRLFRYPAIGKISIFLTEEEAISFCELIEQSKTTGKAAIENAIGRMFNACANYDSYNYCVWFVGVRFG